MEQIGKMIFAIDWTTIAIPAISILEKILRPVIVYIFLVLALRIAGKRELAQLNSFDFVVLLLLSNTVQNAIIGNDNSISGGVIGAITLLITNFCVVRFFYRHPRLEGLFEGQPDMLILDGVLNESILKKELISRAELKEAANKQGIESLKDIAQAEIGADGEVSFVRKETAPELVRHEAILNRLNELEAEIRALRLERHS